MLVRANGERGDVHPPTPGRARWEWRAWGPDVVGAAQQLTRLGELRGRTMRHTDWYLLGVGPDVNVKARGQHVRLKRSVASSADLVAWEAHRFRLASTDGSGPPALDELAAIAGAVAPSSATGGAASLRLAAVHKRRSVLRTPDGVRIEVSRLTLEGWAEALECVSIEGVDAEAVDAAAGALRRSATHICAVHVRIAELLGCPP